MLQPFPRIYLHKTTLLFGIALLLAFSSNAFAQAAPQIKSAIDPNVLVRLKGNTHPLANAQNDRGTVSPSLPMERMLLVLKRPAPQAKAFEAAIDAMHHTGSPNFHKWMTPEQIGAHYGPAQ